MMKRLFSLCVWLLIGPLSADSGEALLFSDDSVLRLSMDVNFKALCRPRETEDCDYTATVLRYLDDDDAEHEIPVEIRIRGGWRSLRENCNVPPLFVRFATGVGSGTPFEGQRVLPLTTHCRSGLAPNEAMGFSSNTDHEQYLLKEYLAYRVYNEMTDASLRVRLARIKYTDPDRSGRVRNQYAFFTEHFDTATRRLGGRLLNRGSFDHEHLDTAAADRLAMFQFMIGNTDWSIVRQRNTILLEMPDGTQLALPYDLDMSGLVNASYAGPPPTLPIRDVRTRYYLGFCHPGIDWDLVFSSVHQNQPGILALPGEIPGLHKDHRRTAKRYLENFFRILVSKSKRQKKIVEACLQWPPVLEDHMSHEAMDSVRRK
jgi:hypothetical protein